MATIGQLQSKYVNQLLEDNKRLKEMIIAMIPLHESCGCDGMVAKAKSLIETRKKINTNREI